MIEKKWILKHLDLSKVKKLKEQLKVTPEPLCSLFVVRGLDNYEMAKDYFTPSITSLHNPWTMKGMEEAVNRVTTAMERKENILLFGDYDVDGTTAVAMMLRFLANHYSKKSIFYYIPDRYKEGYGLSQQGIDFAKEQKVTLIITLDCGITSSELINQSKKEGIDYIICDHHLPGPELPEAAAILNPKQPICNYAFKELCGAGVTFKLITALCNQLGLPSKDYLCYLDMVALATGADVVPILDENRIITFWGLKKINDNPIAGIAAMKKLNQSTKEYTLNRVIFGLAPKINAAGRIHHGKLAVELLTEDDENIALELAKQLFEQNETRKMQDALVTQEAIDILNEKDPGQKLNSSVVFKEGWHKGVLGIVASRLIETFYKPAIVLTKGEEYISGSARSIEGFNIYEAISGCKEYLVRFGGHPSAAGLTMKPEAMEGFARKFEKIVSQTLLPEYQAPRLIIDLEIQPEIIDISFFKTISRMEPFGHGNPEPVFLSRNVSLHPASKIVGDEHVRFVFKIGTQKFIPGIGFNLKEKFTEIEPGSKLDIVYTIGENEWNDQKTLQLKIIDFRTA